MTKSTLLNFQEKAVHELASKMAKHWVKSVSNDKYTLENPIVLASPTGSGKTIMVTEMMQSFKSRVGQLLESEHGDYKYDDNAKEIVENLDDYNPLFIFVSPSAGNLDKQSSDKIKEEGSNIQTLDEELLNVEYWDDVVSDGEFEDNTVMVLSWDKVIRVTNKSRQTTENDTETSFNMIVRKTRKNSPVIMFIDESHKNDTKKSKDVIDAFHPDILVKVSATPKESAISTGNSLPENSVLVSIEDARKEKLIKDSVEVVTHNEGIVFNRNSVIKAAVDKQKELEEALQHENINKSRPDVPLVLIQIENDKQVDGESKTNATLVKEKLLALGVNSDDIAVWLTDKDSVGKVNIDHTLPDKLRPNIRFLIFKTAVATGWDCPRAHILVKLRDVGSQTLDIQTIGRIVRKANNKIGINDDYDNEILKPAYIFVENGISVTDFSKDTASLLGNFIFTAENKGTLKPEFEADVQKLNSLGLQQQVPIKAQMESTNFKEYELRTAIESSIKSAIEMRGVELSFKPKAYIEVSKSRVMNIKDVYTDDMSGSETELVSFSSDTDTEQFFFAKLENLLKEKTLFELIKDTFNSEWIDEKKTLTAEDKTFYDYILGQEDLRTLFTENSLELTESNVITFLINNKRVFEHFSQRLVEEYYGVVKGLNDYATVEFKLPETQNVSKPLPETSKNYLYDVEPDLTSSSTIESDFSEYLRNNANVKWWFKNASSGSNGFGMYYLDRNGEYIGYYPDFIFETTDNKLYIIDTKVGTIDHKIAEKYGAGMKLQKDMETKVEESDYDELIVNMVMRNASNNFIISNSRVFKQPTEKNSQWIDLNI